MVASKVQANGLRNPTYLLQSLALWISGLPTTSQTTLVLIKEGLIPVRVIHPAYGTQIGFLMY